jgi:hypothetical protein
VHSHLLTLEGDWPGAKWVLEWDDAVFIVRAPNGETAFAVETAHAHRAIEVNELYAEGKISLTTPDGPLAFKKHRAAAAALRAFFEAGLRTDPEYLARLRTDAAGTIPSGLVMFVVAGGLFSLYCWWAFTHDDPPFIRLWPRWALAVVGSLIHGVLLVLLAAALAGPLVSLWGLRQWWRFWRIGRSAAVVRSS